MAQVVQAVCPGCGKLLNVPAEWSGRPMRCKHCGAVMQAKPTRPAVPPPPPGAVAAAKPTPAPNPRKVPPVPPVPAAPAKPAPAAIAAPAAPAALAAPAAAFNFPDPAADTGRAPRRRPIKKGTGVGTWIAIGLAALVVVGGGIAAAVYYPKIKQIAANYGKPPKDDEDWGRKARKDGDGKAGGKAGGKAKGGGVGPAGFPRRALIVSVHNYLYANPITAGATGTPDVTRLISSLNRGLNLPLNQIVHLSDNHKSTPRPPLRPVIEEGIKNFLATTRKQDRILLFWIGHTKEIDGKAYLMPLEGEFDNAETLLPLQWVFDEMAKCECRQKVLVLDGNRHNLAQGEERPVPGPMTEGFVKALEAAPKGVQVWAACGKEEESNEIEDFPLGVFLDGLRQALTPEEGNKGALEGRIQKPDEPLPLDVLHKWVGDHVTANAKARGLKQTPLLIGKEPDGGADYDGSEPGAKTPALPVVATANQKFIGELLDEISLPSIKGGEGTGADLNFGNLPPFPPDVMKKYDGSLPADAPLRVAIRKARATLWAISTATVPPDVVEEARAIREKLRFDLTIIRDRYNKPGGGPAELTFRNTFEGKSRDMSRIVARVQAAMEELEGVKELRNAEETPPRWKAHYDYTLARFKAQLAFLEEYNNLLGGMRKELPPSEAIHTGWRMAAKERPGDSVGKQYEKAARKLYGEMIEAHKRTPWEVLGKRERLNALGLEWQAF